MYSSITDHRRTVKQIKKDLMSHYNEKLGFNKTISIITPNTGDFNTDLKAEVDEQVMQLKKLITTLSSENSKLNSKYSQLEKDYNELEKQYTYVYTIAKDYIFEIEKKEAELAKARNENNKSISLLFS